MATEVDCGLKFVNKTASAEAKATISVWVGGGGAEVVPAVMECSCSHSMMRPAHLTPLTPSHTKPVMTRAETTCSEPDVCIHKRNVCVWLICNRAHLYFVSPNNSFQTQPFFSWTAHTMRARKMKLGLFLVLTYVFLLAPVHHAVPSLTLSHLSFKNMDFAMKLYREISSYHDSNIFFSPLSISTSFAALSMAARGETYEEIVRGLSLESLKRPEVPELIPMLFRILNENITQNGTQTLDQDMALFIDWQFSIKQKFEEQMRKYFDAEIRSLNFSDNHEAVRLINAYAQNRTGGKVKDMVSSVHAMTKLMVVNTIFFQGSWEFPFNPNVTTNAPFHIDNYNIVQVPMMFVEDKFYMMEEPTIGVKALKLPYREGVSMLIVLPDKGKDYTEIDDEISARSFLRWIRKLQKIKLEVNMPKFKMEQSYPLQDLLPGIGIRSVFTNSANLTKLTQNTPIKLSEVVHKAVIEVDETGTTAAAATASGIIPYSLPRMFVVNRPFFFFIYHEATNCVLFMGRVINPNQN